MEYRKSLIIVIVLSLVALFVTLMRKWNDCIEVVVDTQTDAVNSIDKQLTEIEDYLNSFDSLYIEVVVVKDNSDKHNIIYDNVVSWSTDNTGNLDLYFNKDASDVKNVYDAFTRFLYIEGIPFSADKLDYDPVSSELTNRLIYNCNVDNQMLNDFASGFDNAIDRKCLYTLVCDEGNYVSCVTAELYCDGVRYIKAYMFHPFNKASYT